MTQPRYPSPQYGGSIRGMSAQYPPYAATPHSHPYISQPYPNTNPVTNSSSPRPQQAHPQTPHNQYSQPQHMPLPGSNYNAPPENTVSIYPGSLDVKHEHTNSPLPSNRATPRPRRLEVRWQKNFFIHSSC